MSSPAIPPNPPKIDKTPLFAKPTPKKLNEMDDIKWAAYQERVIYWYANFASKEKPVLKKGNYLYHATAAKNIGAITSGGLCPRDPSWKTYDKKEKVPRFDASKDGYLSMSTTVAGAGSMDGKSILLRMEIEDDIAKYDFRKFSTTEVRTLTSIPAGKLTKSPDGKDPWLNLSPRQDTSKEAKSRD
jgi:hypothetical protein